MLQETKLIIGSAKDCDRWEYYYAVPPKEKGWNLIFSFETNDGKIAKIDASEWEYTLLEYDDGMFEIVIKTTDFKQLNESDKQTAVEILLDGILGEEIRM